MWWGHVLDNTRQVGGLGPKVKNQAIMAWFEAGFVMWVGGCVRSSELSGPPSHGNLSGGELGVNCLDGKG